MAEIDPAAPGPSVAATVDWRAKYEDSEAKRKKTTAALVSPHTHAVNKDVNTTQYKAIPRAKRNIN
jgi:hypothetical protein